MLTMWNSCALLCLIIDGYQLKYCQSNWKSVKEASTLFYAKFLEKEKCVRSYFIERTVSHDNFLKKLFLVMNHVFFNTTFPQNVKPRNGEVWTRDDQSISRNKIKSEDNVDFFFQLQRHYSQQICSFRTNS